MGRLLVGETPDRKREIAYNAYRAVDDEAERAFIQRLEAEAAHSGGGGEGAGDGEVLYTTFLRHQDVPETLAQEFELFRMMDQACRCYDINTILATDPRVDGLAEAVRLTVRLIAYAVDLRQGTVRLTLDDYRSVLTGPPVAP